MGKNLHWVQQLADRADLQGEALPGIPIVELAGDRRVLIERHNGVTEYSPQRICVGVSYGVVSIIGRELKLMRMSKEQVVICGRVDEISILRRFG